MQLERSDSGLRSIQTFVTSLTLGFIYITSVGAIVDNETLVHLGYYILIFLISRAVVVDLKDLKLRIIPFFDVTSRDNDGYVTAVAHKGIALDSRTLTKLSLSAIMRRNNCSISVRSGSKFLLLPSYNIDHDRIYVEDTSAPLADDDIKAIANLMLPWALKRQEAPVDGLKQLCAEFHSVMAVVSGLKDRTRRDALKTRITDNIAACTTEPGRIVTWHVDEQPGRVKEMVGEALIYFDSLIRWSDLVAHAGSLTPTAGCEFLAQTRRCFLPVVVAGKPGSELKNADGQTLITKRLAMCTKADFILVQNKAASYNQLAACNSDGLVYVVPAADTKIYKATNNKNQPLVEITCNVKSAEPLLDFKSLHQRVMGRTTTTTTTTTATTTTEAVGDTSAPIFIPGFDDDF